MPTADPLLDVNDLDASNYITKIKTANTVFFQYVHEPYRNVDVEVDYIDDDAGTASSLLLSESPYNIYCFAEDDWSFQTTLSVDKSPNWLAANVPTPNMTVGNGNEVSFIAVDAFMASVGQVITLDLTPPTINPITLSSDETNINVTVSLDETGTVWCQAVRKDFNPPTILEILALRHQRQRRCLLRRIAQCSDGVALLPNARPFRVEGEALGLVLPEAAEQLKRFPEVFQVHHHAVDLVAGDSQETRSQAVASVLQALREEDGVFGPVMAQEAVPMLRGWRDEAWPVKASFHQEPPLERSAGPLFGVPGYGCHVNGFQCLNGATMLWVARRSRTPGGLSHGEVPQENVKRECWEEARVPEEISSSAQPCGVVSYVQLRGWGIKRDVLFCYDLQLPEDFEPHAGDGEVESFSLMSLEDVVDSLAAEGAEPDWKPNVCLVILDMLVRRGVLQPEEDGYVELVHGLRRSS
eukprot:g525.t1